MIKVIEFGVPSMNGTVYSIETKSQVVSSLKAQGYKVIEKDNSIYIEITTDVKLK
ncbi:hypothetical protein [Providencia phage PSTRCR_127]|nr:hypothetical protein [Providencia phage PSTRCR_127]QQV88906.1 hypothetical protein [Providencia phage PSTRCR_121]UGO50066.1 hypothetical protein RGZ1_35 [Morganella phage vB_MmoM_Rgz1]